MRRRSRSVFILLIVLAVAAAAVAGSRRHALAAGGGSSDAPGIRPFGGASVSGRVASVDGAIITLDTGGAPAVRIDASGAKIDCGPSGPCSLGSASPGSWITALIAFRDALPAGAPIPAAAIVVESRPDLRIAGPVGSVDLNSSTLVVLGITVAVDSQTLFSTTFPTFAPMRGLEDLSPGQPVTIDAALAGSSILAKRIVVDLPVPPPLLAFSGTVKSIAPTSWVITDAAGAEIALLISERTKITGDPAVGDPVDVLAEQDSSGNYLAVLIARGGTPPPPPEFAMRGWVHSIGPDFWTIGGPPGSLMADFQVRVNSKTVIYPDPKIGDQVAVKGIREADGTVVATSIEKIVVEPPVSTVVEVRGTIASIRDNEWVLDGPWMMPMPMVVRLTPQTFVYPDPKVGDRVIVAGTRENNVITALKIAKEE